MSQSRISDVADILPCRPLSSLHWNEVFVHTMYHLPVCNVQQRTEYVPCTGL